MTRLLPVLAVCGCQASAMQRIPSAPPPVVEIVDVRADDTLSDNETLIAVGDTVTWTLASKHQKIVRVGSTVGEPCDNAATYPHATNEFSSRRPVGNPGLFAKALPAVEVSSMSSCPAGTTLATTSTTDGAKYCIDGNVGATVNPQLAEYPFVSGITCLLNWPRFEPTNDGYEWALLDACFDAAKNNGKGVILGFSVLDATSTPKLGHNAWAFGGGALASAVTLQDEDTSKLGGQDCGNNGNQITMASPSDDDWRTIMVDLVSDICTHMKQDTGWHNSLVQFHIPGFSFGGTENKVPKECPDYCPASCDGSSTCDISTCGGGDNQLDAYNGDACICNSLAWANAGWSPAELAEYYDVVGAAIQSACGSDVGIGYPLIQDGWPEGNAGSPVNFDGDPNAATSDTTLRTVGNSALLCPACTSADDANILSGVKTTESNIDAIKQAFGQDAFIQHNGSGLWTANAPWAVPLVNGIPDFPIPSSAQITQSPVYLNKWSTKAGIEGYFSGGQQEQESGGFNGPEDLDGVMWNVTINSNYIRTEFNGHWLWRISKDFAGGTATLDPMRVTPAAAKSATEWNDILWERRRELAATFGYPTSGAPDPGPSSHSHTFTQPGTYAYTIGRSCLDGSGTLGVIIVSK